MTTNDTLNLNISYENIKSNKINVTFFNVYIITTSIIAAYYFIVGESQLKVNDDHVGFKNIDKVCDRNIGLYYLILASFVCIIYTLIPLINNDFIELFDVVLIICFASFSFFDEHPYEEYKKFLDLENNTIYLRSDPLRPLSIYQYISKYNYLMQIHHVTHLLIRYIPYIDDRTRANFNHSENEFDLVFTYRFELINVAMCILCVVFNIALDIIMKDKFHLQSIDKVIVSLVSIMSCIYMMVSLNIDPSVGFLAETDLNGRNTQDFKAVIKKINTISPRMKNFSILSIPYGAYAY